MIARISALYLAIFAAVLAVISTVAFWLVGREYASLLAPALSTPEGAAGYRTAMMHVALTIGGADLPLLIFVGVLAYFLARLSLAPLIAARERERQFASDAAHELRSPLATIASVAQAARPHATPETREAFDTITATALDAGALIGDLLTLSRDPRPGLLQSEQIDLSHVVESCAREFEPRLQGGAGSSKVRLDVKKPSAIVYGDERRLRELVRNLLDNAIRHANTSIALECGNDGRFGYIRVRDDGAGIPADLRDRVFDRFFSANGSGLGLALSRWIAEAHKGTLTLEEAPNGASFIARFPNR